MREVWLFFIGNMIFMFPIYVDIFCIYDQKCGKTFLSLALFGVNIKGGYITRDRLKFFIHLSEKTAFMFDLENFIKSRKKMFKIQGITSLKFKTLSRIGNENSAAGYALPLFVVVQTISPLIREVKPCLGFKNDLEITDGAGLNVFLEYKFVFNLLSLNEIFLKGLLKKVVKLLNGNK